MKRSWMLFVVKKFSLLLKYWVTALNGWIIRYEQRYSDQIATPLSNTTAGAPEHWLKKTQQIRGAWIGTGDINRATQQAQVRVQISQRPSGHTPHTPTFNSQHEASDEIPKRSAWASGFSSLLRLVQKNVKNTYEVQLSNKQSPVASSSLDELAQPDKLDVHRENNLTKNQQTKKEEKQEKQEKKVLTILEEDISLASVLSNQKNNVLPMPNSQAIHETSAVGERQKVLTTHEVPQMQQKKSVSWLAKMQKKSTSFASVTTESPTQPQRQKRNESEKARAKSNAMNTEAVTNDWPKLPAQSIKPIEKQNSMNRGNTESRLREFQRLQVLERRQRRPPWIV